MNPKAIVTLVDLPRERVKDRPAHGTNGAGELNAVEICTQWHSRNMSTFRFAKQASFKYCALTSARGMRRALLEFAPQAEAAEIAIR
jgi:hypothetical protein